MENYRPSMDSIDDYFEQMSRLDYGDLIREPHFLKDLQREVAKSNGLVRIFIHPLFDELRKDEDSSPKDDQTLKRQKRIAEALAQMIQSESDKVPPIIIFEEADRIKDALKLLEQSVEGQEHRFYFIPTDPNNPTPEFPDVARDKYGLTEQTAAWDKMANLLTQVGVTRIIIGGQFLGVHENKEEEIDELSGCVARAAENLGQRLGDNAIEISYLSSPSNREDIKQKIDFKT